MKMTDAQRLILSNQYYLMSQLDPDNSLKYNRLKTIIEHGYELNMIEISQHFGCLLEEDCREIIDILEMHHAMQESYNNLPKEQQKEIEARRLQFLGFDLSTETQRVNYVRFLIDSEGMYSHFNKADHYFNSQVPMLEKYQRMLKTWRDCPRQYHLSPSEFCQILCS